MRLSVTNHMVSSALKHKTAKGDVSMHALAAASSEVGIVVPSILRKNLKDAGYSVEVKTKNHGFQVRVFGPLKMLMDQKHAGALDLYECETRDPKAGKPENDLPVLVAQAYSRTEEDALLQAVYAAMKEEKSETKDTAPEALADTAKAAVKGKK